MTAQSPTRVARAASTTAAARRSPRTERAISRAAEASERRGVPAARTGATEYAGDVYQPRTIRFIRREDVGNWRLKVYGIGTHALTPGPSSSRRRWGRPAAFSRPRAAPAS